MKKYTSRGVSVLLVLLMLLTAALSAPSAFAAEEAETQGTALTEESVTEDAALEAPAEEEKEIPLDARSNSRGQLFTTSPMSTLVSSAADAKSSEDLAAVQDIKTVSDSSDKITLSWSAVQGAAGYNIYYKSLNNKDASLSLLTSVKGTSVTLHNVAAGTKWQFEICAYGIYRGNVFEGETTVYQTGSKPQMVKNFELVASGSVIGLHWDIPTRADGYIIYRESASTNGHYDEYWRLSDSVRQFNDKNTVNGEVYTYRIVAYINIGSQTIIGPTNQIRAMKGLCSPGDDGSRTLLSKAWLKWNENDYAYGYEIQVSSDNKTYSTYATTSATSIHTARYSSGSVRYFRIVPYAYGRGYKVYGTYTQLRFTIQGGIWGEYVGSTFVEISIDDQYMWFFKDGRQIVGTPVVTGNYGSMDTPRGYHSVQNKASPCTLSGPGYTSYVDYWIAFIGSGYGIHDASWRTESEFGGDTYKGNGSHGCVNTPYNAVRTIYNNISVGTPVIVY